MRARRLFGVWLDLSKAVIVEVSGGRQEVKTILSGIETRERIAGQGNEPGRFGKQYLSNDQSRQRRIEADGKRYLEKVLRTVAPADQIVIYGPASMKNSLADMIRSRSEKVPHIREVLPADSMTDNQIAAMVRTYFGK